MRKFIFFGFVIFFYFNSCDEPSGLENFEQMKWESNVPFTADHYFEVPADGMVYELTSTNYSHIHIRYIQDNETVISLSTSDVDKMRYNDSTIVRDWYAVGIKGGYQMNDTIVISFNKKEEASNRVLKVEAAAKMSTSIISFEQKTK